MDISALGENTGGDIHDDSHIIENEADEDIDDDLSNGSENVEEQKVDDNDDEYHQPAQPNEKKINSMPFSFLCDKLERAERSKKIDGKKKEEILESILPKDFLADLASSSQSIFPMLRLLLPEKDNKRGYLGMQEKFIAASWSDALGLSKDAEDRKKLEHFKDPALARTAKGDLSRAVLEVMQKRFLSSSSSSGNNKKFKIKHVNQLLDQLAEIKKGNNLVDSSLNFSHSFSSESQQYTTYNSNSQSQGQANRNVSFGKKNEQRKLWVKELIKHTKNPTEHKWIVRIILQDLNIGLRWNSMLSHIHFLANDLYQSNRSLESVCTCLSDPKWMEIKMAKRKKQWEERKQDEQALSEGPYLPTGMESIKLSNTIGPMVSKRTSFLNAITDMEDRHQKHAQKLRKDSSSMSSSLSPSKLNLLTLKFPAFIVEEKVDGERMIVHIDHTKKKKNGLVTMHTRQGNWYSLPYSPVLGPALRKSLTKYKDVDVILDGEIVSWDDSLKQVIKFGVNRSVAIERRKYMEKMNMLEDQDLNMTDDDHPKDATVISVSSLHANMKKKTQEEQEQEEEEGSFLWLTYVVFDILYIDGPGAESLLAKLNKSCSLKSDAHKLKPGSLLDVGLFMRKAILYELITPQENEVVFVDSIVVRPDGTFMNAEDYFITTANTNNNSTNNNEEEESKSTQEFKQYGYPSYLIDSVKASFNGTIPNIEDIDRRRREQIRSVTRISSHTKMENEIAQSRAWVVDDFYERIVKKCAKEGLVFKDLASPYILGERSRSYKYWLKLKDDYNQAGHSSDIDLIVLGGYFLKGKFSGRIYSFMLGCLDEERSLEKGRNMYMPLVTVYGGHVRAQLMKDLLRFTGFEYSEEKDTEYGYWKQLPDGKHGKELPDYISKYTFQDSDQGEEKPWKFRKVLYPHMWIDPEDSFVVTVNAGEIISSDSWSAGVSLRFPRITQIRHDKSVNMIETVNGLHELYHEREQSKAISSSESQSQSQSFMMMMMMSQQDNQTLFPQLPSMIKRDRDCRFLTSHDLQKRKRKQNQIKNHQVKINLNYGFSPDTIKKKSSAFQGITFHVLEGNYNNHHQPTQEENNQDEDYSQFNYSYSQSQLNSYSFTPTNEPFSTIVPNDVKSREDITNFIGEHGGKCVSFISTDLQFILGASKDAAKVKNISKAMEMHNRAEQKQQQQESSTGNKRKKPPSKGAQKLKATKETQLGVLKWKFVFSLFQRWLEQVRSENSISSDTTSDFDWLNESISIKNRYPKLLETRLNEYLVCSEARKNKLMLTCNQFGDSLHEPSQMPEFLESMEEVSQMIMKKRKKQHEVQAQQDRPMKWQYLGMKSLSPDDRWILGGKDIKLWPSYRCSTDDKKENLIITNKLVSSRGCILYPDIFPDFGYKDESRAIEDCCYEDIESSRWRDYLSPLENDNSTIDNKTHGIENKYIESIKLTIPLASTMGALVTPHLHHGVTHVLCELKKDYLEMKWEQNLSANIFADKERGVLLHQRLVELYKEKSVEEEKQQSVTLVTPKWVETIQGTDIETLLLSLE